MKNDKRFLQNEKSSQTTCALIRRILVAIDLSHYSKPVMSAAAALAVAMGADVVVLSVVKMPSLVTTEGEINHTQIQTEENELVRHHKQLIDEYFQNFRLLVESRILHGDPATKICEYAEEFDADLVILGTRGLGLIRSLILGSVSGKVAHDCKRSVLIVKAKM